MVAALASFGMVQAADPALSKICRSAADEALAKFSLKPEQIGITLVRLDRSPARTSFGDFQGDRDMYPASVVKLFYLAYAGHLLDERKIKSTPEFERGVHDMIVDSVNDATGLVLETITETTGGPELSPRELARWMDKRQAVNRWFTSLGYPKLNACQKTWNEGPYGRERQGYGPKFELRNSLSPNVCARLMSEIALDRIASPTRCDWMRGVLSRVIPAEGGTVTEQASGFSGKVLPAGTKLWSKAGWTSEVRHDVAWVRFPDGKEFVWAIFTKGNGEKSDLIPFVAEQLMARIGETPRVL